MRRTLLAVVGACSFEPGTLPADARIFEDAAIDAPLGPWGAPTVVTLPAPANTDDDPSLTGEPDPGQPNLFAIVARKSEGALS